MNVKKKFLTQKIHMSNMEALAYMVMVKVVNIPTNIPTNQHSQIHASRNKDVLFLFVNRITKPNIHLCHYGIFQAKQDKVTLNNKNYRYVIKQQLINS